MVRRRTPSAGCLCAAFYLAFFTLFASGRLASADAGGQLQAATLLVTTGHLGSERPPAGRALGWQIAPNGRYYEPHDLGNIALMAPAAWIGHATSGPAAAQDVWAPSPVSRLLTALTYAIVNALTCVWFFQLLAMRRPTRDAFLLSLVFATATFFLPYAKTAWDVVGACAGVSALLYASARLLAGHHRRRDIVAVAAAFTAACTFRFSLIPFLAIGVAAVVFALRRDIGWRGSALLASGVAIGFVPSFIYNHVRTGEFWRPATATRSYLSTNNAPGGSGTHGAIGLLVAPNRGLFFYSPVLLVLVALPFVWRRIAREERLLFAAFGGAAALYWLAIARLKNWGGAAGWGPRYLLPVLPVLAFGVAIAMKPLLPRWRTTLAALVAVSVVLSVVPATVNLSLALVTYPRALDQDGGAPYQQAAAWRAFEQGLRGEAPEIPAAVAANRERLAAARFPDFWTARLMQRTRALAALGAIITLLLLLISVGVGAALLNPAFAARSASRARDRPASSS